MNGRTPWWLLGSPDNRYSTDRLAEPDFRSFSTTNHPPFDRARFPLLNKRIWEGLCWSMKRHDLDNPALWLTNYTPIDFIRMPCIGMVSLYKIASQLKALGYDVATWLPAFDGTKNVAEFRRNYQRQWYRDK